MLKDRIRKILDRLVTSCERAIGVPYEEAKKKFIERDLRDILSAFKKEAVPEEQPGYPYASYKDAEATGFNACRRLMLDKIGGEE